MTLGLRDLGACFDGVIPSIIATAAGDGTPNISYLSHVVLVDDDHVALSNQFFGKTATNLRENPQATLLLVDGRDGSQYRVAVLFVRSLIEGSLFDRVAAQLRATSAQVGMAGVMRLRAVDVFRVVAIRAVPRAVAPAAPQPRRDILAATAGLVETLADAGGTEAIVEAVLDGLSRGFGYGHALLLLCDSSRDVLVTVGSRGYAPSGIGSEVPMGAGLIGSAASDRLLVKISDMSRVRRLGAAIRASSGDEERLRTITLPGLGEAMSQLAVPMIAQGRLLGVLFVESAARLAFTDQDEALLTILARQAAASLALSAGEDIAVQLPEKALMERRAFRVTHHAFDDSVFVDGAYVIKGVAGRILVFLIERHLRDHRNEFTNREIRLADSLRLPEFKDNLETRILLLRRRLDEKNLPLRLPRTGRGRIRLELDGSPILETVTG